MKTFRLRLVNKLILSSLQRLLPFSFHSVANPKSWNSFDDVVEGGSAVYRNALKFQRPSTINWSDMNCHDIELLGKLENSVSFIGSVARAPKVLNTKSRRFSIYTLLNVRPSRDSNSSSFRVLLLMRDKMAEVAFKHLKHDDFIHVSGYLGSYVKDDGCRNLTLRYKIIVEELNYVAQYGKKLSYQEYEESESSQDIGYTGLDKHNNRIHLWQVFFTNPLEWWDNRKRKNNPRQPDFKHRDTDEALWLNQNDPPWVKRQLQLLDLKMDERGQCERVNTHSRVSSWVYDE